MHARAPLRIVLFGLLGSCLLGAGCGHLRPWEREHQARMERQVDRCEAARAYEAHFWMVREGAAGGTGEPGGGCGCN